MSDDQNEWEQGYEDPTAVPLWSSLTELAPVRVFRERAPSVEARQHDGSWLSAETIQTWIRSLAPETDISILPPGTFNGDPINAYVAIQMLNRITYIASGDWVVYDYNSQFQFIKAMEFGKKYEEIIENRRS